MFEKHSGVLLCHARYWIFRVTPKESLFEPGNSVSITPLQKNTQHAYDISLEMRYLPGRFSINAKTSATHLCYKY